MQTPKFGVFIPKCRQKHFDVTSLNTKCVKNKQTYFVFAK